MAGLLIDQQLPQALAAHLATRGHDAKHVKEYPSGSTLPDAEIAKIADAEGRIVVTKDEDFRISHLLYRHPARLVQRHVRQHLDPRFDLLALIDEHHAQLIEALTKFNYLELGRSGVIIHDPA